MKTFMAICIALFINLIPGFCSARPSLVVCFTPGILLYSPDADGFIVNDGDTAGEVSGSMSNMGTLTAGVSFDTPKLFIDIAGGGGYLYNSAFNAKMFMGDVALRFKIRRDELTAGPHFSLVKYDPEWDGDSNISLSETTGYMAGFFATMGSKESSFWASLDYVSASFDVEPSSINTDALDISGFAFQVGMLFRF